MEGQNIPPKGFLRLHIFKSYFRLSQVGVALKRGKSIRKKK
jgi:hypothetical protein